MTDSTFSRLRAALNPSRGKGWLKDALDPRDFQFAAKPEVIASLPDRVDLSAGMPPVYDQGQAGCHDDQTEVLTDRGWRMWQDVEGSELLATVNRTDHAMEFQAPTALIRCEYDGPLYHINHQSLSFGLTPNHRMYSRRWDERARTLRPGFEMRTIENIGWYAGLLATPSGFAGTELRELQIGSRVYTGDDLLALLALITSDGWVGGTDNNWNIVSFCCFREDRLPMVRAFGARMGLHEIPGRPGVWKWADAALARWVRANLYTTDVYRSPNKRVPELVKVASTRQIEHFLKFFGDQHVGKDSGRDFFTSSRRMADDLQELLLRIGRRAGIYERDPRSTTMADGRKIEADHCSADITVSEWLQDRLSIERKRQIETESYKGMVYCATVPNSTLITRRNGKVLISGNSCTGNGWAAAFDYERKRQGLDFMTPSRLFVYYNERLLEGTTNSDAGAQIRDGIKTLAQQGVCPEAEWPYDLSQLYAAPPQADYTDALANLALTYQRVTQSPQQIMGCLAQGFPIVFGFLVFQGYENIRSDGLVPMPGPREQPLGGHCNTLCGYQTVNGRVQVLSRNSWGRDWGQGGYCWFPMEYLTNSQLCDDFWMLQSVSQPTPTPTPPTPPTPVPPAPPIPTPTPTPTPPPLVGAGILAAMQAEHDSPATPETWPGDGSSNAYGRSGSLYVYLNATVKVSVFKPRRVV